MKKIIFSILTICVIILFIIFPQTVKSGLCDGLMLWFNGLLPALLPFMFINHIVIGFHLSDSISKIFVPFTKLLKIHRFCAYPIMSGLLFGCPSCAITCDLLIKNKQISQEEAEFCVCVFNQISPSFILFYLCFGILQDYKYRFLIPVIFYLSLLLSAIILRRTHFGRFQNESYDTHKIVSDPVNPFLALDEAIARSVSTIIKLCGYIILSSILISFCEQFLPSKIDFLINLVEVTYGTKKISSIPWDDHKTLLNSLILISFGGISALIQTFGVITTNYLSAKRYLCAKAVFTGVVICITYITFLILFLI